MGFKSQLPLSPAWEALCSYFTSLSFSLLFCKVGRGGLILSIAHGLGIKYVAQNRT